MTGSRLLRQYLKETGKTLADLARDTGLDDGLLSRFARGMRRPGLESATKLEQATAGKVPAASWLKGGAANAA